MLHEDGFATQDICRFTDQKSADSLKHYINSASTRKTVGAADVLEDLVNPQYENNMELHNSDLVATQAAPFRLLHPPLALYITFQVGM